MEADSGFVMPPNHFMMWGMLIVMTLGAVAGPMVHGNLLGQISAAYPTDITRREALARCDEMDSGFSRFSAQDREVCYRAVLHMGEQSTIAAAGLPAARGPVSSPTVGSP